MRKLFVLLMLILALTLCAASAENLEILGQPFPDFTVTDTEGNTFTLSEALLDHEAALINIWATWCPPCQREFPYLNEVYEKYGDDVAFIALSCESADTLEKIAAFRQQYGVTFAMGSDSKTGLAEYVYASAIPTTVIVDRFGNAAFMQSCSFRDAAEVERLVKAFLGAGYTETRVYTEIPKVASTAAFSVAVQRDIIVENPSAQRITVFWQGKDTEMPVYVINDDTAHLRLVPDAYAYPDDVIYYDYETGEINLLSGLMDPMRGTYVYDQAMPVGGAEYHYTAGVLATYSQSDERDVMAYFISSEDYIEEFMEEFRAQGYDVTWAYAEDAAPEEAVGYTIHVADQNGAPVSGVYVNFCTDTYCATAKSDDDGVIFFDDPADIYHVELLKVPAGYSFDSGFSMYTGPHYGEWLLRIKKD